MLPPERVRRRLESAVPATDMLALQVLFALRAGVQTVDNALSRWMGDDALTPGRWQVLVVLWSTDHPIPQKEIVNALKVSRATVSDLVETLLGEGHVAVSPGQDDKRQVLVTLTPSGRDMTDLLVRENAARLRRTFGRLTSDDLRTLIDLLNRMTAFEPKPQSRKTP